MPPSRILVVDDEPGMLEVCADILARLPQAEVTVESESARAAARLADERFDLLVTDIRMPGLGGIELLRIARERHPSVPVVMLTAFPSMESAVESLRLGATDYLVKPFDPEDLLKTVRRLLERQRLDEENRLLRRQVERGYDTGEIVGTGAAMRQILDLATRVAESDVDVLIVGETGAGKELVARTIHKRGRRAAGRFVPIDCGAIPENLLEGELFGYEGGSPPRQAPGLGLFEYADGGTVFLDEIGDLPPALQPRLLRVLQERRFRRVGGRAEVAVDVRIVAATRRDLPLEVREGRFRDDLLYRIKVAQITIPPLRDHAEDIPDLVNYFVTRFAREMGREGVEVDGEAAEILSRYPWPGNVRELQNALKRALVVGRDRVLTPRELPDEVVIQSGRGNGHPSPGFFTLRAERMAAFEREYLASSLRTARGDVAAAAREAHVPRGTFYRLLRRHGLDPDSFRDVSPEA